MMLQGAVELAHELTINKKAARLGMYGNGIDDVGMQALAQALEQNEMLP
jgi:hypothetical protein